MKLLLFFIILSIAQVNAQIIGDYDYVPFPRRNRFYAPEESAGTILNNGWPVNPSKKRSDPSVNLEPNVEPGLQDRAVISYAERLRRMLQVPIEEGPQNALRM